MLGQWFLCNSCDQFCLYGVVSCFLCSPNHIPQFDSRTQPNAEQKTVVVQLWKLRLVTPHSRTGPTSPANLIHHPRWSVYDPWDDPPTDITQPQLIPLWKMQNNSPTPPMLFSQNPPCFGWFQWWTVQPSGSLEVPAISWMYNCSYRGYIRYIPTLGGLKIPWL